MIAICNQKGGVTKTTTTVNLGTGLALQGKSVLLVDADPQADLTTSPGWPDNDNLSVTLATLMDSIIQDKPISSSEGILHHAECVDLVPASMELSGMEIALVGATSIRPSGGPYPFLSRDSGMVRRTYPRCSLRNRMHLNCLPHGANRKPLHFLG